MKKKLLFTINTMGRAGAEVALIQLLKQIVAMEQFEVDLYSIIPRGELFAEIPEGVNVLNSKPRTASVLSVTGRLFIVYETIKAFSHRLTGFRLLPYLWRNMSLQKKRGVVQPDKLLWRLLAEGQKTNSKEYDLAIAFIEGGATYYLTKKVTAKKKAAFVHIDYQQAGYLPMMDQNCYDKIDRIFVVSKEVGKRFSEVYPEHGDKIFLFRNIIDRQEIIAKSKLGVGFTDDFTGIRLLTLGRLSHQKGYDIAVRALKLLKDRGYPVRWYVIGDGPEKRNLRRLISELDVGNDFILLGAKNNPFPYVKQADIYVHATRYEGKSIAIEEAQILQKPILATRCTGTTEQIKSGVDGLLIELSPENLADSLGWLIDHPEEQEIYSDNLAKKQLLFPEDMDNLLSLLD